jgi:LPS O-antigen subunit length determinant protein (WzzB/FepE family)
MDQRLLDAQENRRYQEDEIDLKQLIRPLIQQKMRIFWITLITTLCAIAYVQWVATHIYVVEGHVLSPDVQSVIELNKDKVGVEVSKDFMYSEFLAAINSYTLQKKVFDEGDYVRQLDPENLRTVDDEAVFRAFIDSWIIQAPTHPKKGQALVTYEKPPRFVLEGSEPVMMAEFLNTLIKKADRKTVSKLVNSKKKSIDVNLKRLEKKKTLLIKKAKEDRLASISRMEEADKQKAEEIRDKLTRLRVKAKQDREAEIIKKREANELAIETNNHKIERLRLQAKHQRLTEISRIQESNRVAIRDNLNQMNRLRQKSKTSRLDMMARMKSTAKLAGDLGIEKPNFHQIDNVLTVVATGEQKVPKWYLYGRDALLKEAETLRLRKDDDPYILELPQLKLANKRLEEDEKLLSLINRKSDDPYIPEIAVLQSDNQRLREDKSLLALINRKSDDPYIAEISKLQAELSQVKSNQTLVTLKSRQDDRPFITEMNALDSEVLRLKEITFDVGKISAVRVVKPAVFEDKPIKPRKKLMVVLAFLAGLMFSVFVVLISAAFKEDDSVNGVVLRLS